MIVNELTTALQTGLSLNDNQFVALSKPVGTLVGFSIAFFSFMVLFFNHFLN